MTNDSTSAEYLGASGFASFKLELSDAVTNEVLGVYDEVVFNKNNYSQYANNNYIIETDGIGNKEVKLRLVVNENIGANYSLTKIVTDEGLSGKINYQTVSFMSSMEVKDYGSAQNYPNPFNPTTTINYALKEEGKVILKIYNMLGKEIQTLVNTYQPKGRYEVKFNASNLASGVYLYRLNINDYSSTKKMILLR